MIHVIKNIKTEEHKMLLIQKNKETLKKNSDKK